MNLVRLTSKNNNLLIKSYLTFYKIMNFFFCVSKKYRFFLSRKLIIISFLYFILIFHYKPCIWKINIISSIIQIFSYLKSRIKLN